MFRTDVSFYTRLFSALVSSIARDSEEKYKKVRFILFPSIKKSFYTFGNHFILFILFPYGGTFPFGANGFILFEDLRSFGGTGYALAGKVGRRFDSLVRRVYAVWSVMMPAEHLCYYRSRVVSYCA